MSWLSLPSPPWHCYQCATDQPPPDETTAAIWHEEGLTIVDGWLVCLHHARERARVLNAQGGPRA